MQLTEKRLTCAAASLYNVGDLFIAVRTQWTDSIISLKNVLYTEDHQMKHKQLISLLTAAITGISAAAIPTIIQETQCLTASAATGDWHEEWLNGNIIYGYYEGTNEAIITKCYGEYKTPGSDFTIPSYINGMPVTTIASLAFNAKIFHSVTIPDTVKVIEPRAFEACTITSVSLPDSLESIGAYAFSRSWLESVTVPAGVKTIEESTFAGCDRMTSVTLEGAELIKVNAFLNCNNITSLTIPDNCKADGNTMAFSDCKKLDTINGYTAVTEETDENGVSYPVLDPHIYNIVNEHFSRCFNVKFIDEYCTKLCNYVVATETDEWMNDALKAKQLHDWLVRNCVYDYDYVSSRYDLRHFIYSSFFLSFGTSSPGTDLSGKMGKTVCEGYAKAYTMLLSACGIESYVINDDNGSDGHAYNAVKINTNGTDRYYQVDVTWDDAGDDPIYDLFLKSSTDMYAAHGNKYPFQRVEDLSDEHPLLDQYHESYEFLKDQCTQSMPDINGDGILDFDFDMDGYDFGHDFMDDLNAYQTYLMFSFGFGSSTDQINNRLSDVLANLHALNMSYGQYIYDSAPKDAAVASGETAEFSIRLFGDDLTYQWYIYNQSSGQWESIQSEDAVGPTLHITANAQTNGTQYRCYVWNKDGYYLYSNPVTLTLT